MSDDSHVDENETILQKRLRARIAQLGTNPRAVSDKAELGPTAVRDILDGRSRSPRQITLKKIARALNCDLSYLTGDTQSVGGSSTAKIKTAPVIGDVRAGIWMEADEFSAGVDLSELEQVPCVTDLDYPSVQQIAFRVVGDSINQICPDGGFAICLLWSELGVEPAPGMFVVAERNRHGLYETTIKQLEGQPGDWRLLPRSTNPDYKTITFPSDSDDEEVRIIALVRRFVTPTLTW